MPSRRPHRTALVIAAAFACALLVAPVWGYTIYLRDGSKIIANQKYTVRGDKAIIVLESGTESVLPLAEIDILRTEKANQNNLGTAVVIEGGQVQDLDRNTAPPPKKATLQDLIQSRGAQNQGTAPPATEAPVRRTRAEASAATPSREPDGRTPLRNVDLAQAIRTFLFGRGVTSVEVLQGSSSKRPVLVFSTGTEGQVFKALTASANALLHVRDLRPGEVDSFEVTCNSTAGGSAGRFTLTPPIAQDLVAGRIELPAFYVKYVQF